jgi:glycosyltransferase involved in cell wall biosynthesis
MNELPSLRLCVLGDLESIHTRRWLQPFIQRGHDVHFISYYRPKTLPQGIKLHILNERSPRSQTAGNGPTSQTASKLPPDLLRLANAFRYRTRGLKRVLREVKPDLLHAHYVVEYGFFAATAGFHPLVISAWGSDVLVAAKASRLAGFITRYTLRRADLITSNNEHMTETLRQMGVPQERLATIVFGTDAFFLERPEASVNRLSSSAAPPTIISTRSLDSPLYNIDLVLRAVASLVSRFPDVQLLIAGTGTLRPKLEALTRDLGLDKHVQFVGWLDNAALRDAFLRSHVYVSVPDSDATSVSTLSAMAAGCFPVLSDLPTQREWIEDGVNGFLTPLHDVQGLSVRLGEALHNEELRREAAEHNREVVEARGLWENSVPIMEAWYRQLAERRSR